MATLVSPGVSVTVTNQSFFIPATAPTVPLLFIATADHKTQPNSTNPAEGTYEYGVVRTITSLTQSTTLYGIPRFLSDPNTGAPYYGDARNETGLFALNEFLSIADQAYVVRANVNLDDNYTDLVSLWDSEISVAETLLENNITSYLAQYNISNNFIPSSPSTSGHQVVNYGGTINNTTTLGVGIPSSTYTATITINGTPYAISYNLSTLSTFSDLVNQINTQLTGAGVASVPTAPAVGNLTVTSATTGSTSTVAIVDGNYAIQSATSGLHGTFVFNGNVTGVFSNGFVFTIANSTSNNGTYTVQGSTYLSGQTTVTVVGTVPSASGVSGNVVGFFGAVTGFASISAAVAGTNGYRTTVTSSEYLSLVATSMASVYALYSFSSSQFQTGFISDQHLSPLNVYGNGFSSPSTGTYDGLTYIADNIALFPGFPGGGTVAGEFTPVEGGDLLSAVADVYQLTTKFLNSTMLGANDAARRVAIVAALNAAVNSNTAILSENFQYNLILCPGYSEVVPALLNLCVAIQEEALVIGDPPNNLSPDGITNPSTGWAVSVNRVLSTDVAYYYPWGLGTNLDGSSVMVAPSGIALYTYAYNDNVAYLWFAPAGTNRGIIDPNIIDLGYASGTLGTATTFVQTLLNQGQRDQLYQYSAAGGINPLCFFPGYGFVIWGQKTSTGLVASSLDRVNVSRLVKYIKRSLRVNAMPFVFEPNDQLTRNNLQTMVNNFLGNLIVKRGLYDYATVCDSTNNTPAVIQANQLIIDVALQPVIAAEFIYIPITVVATGAALTSSS